MAQAVLFIRRENQIFKNQPGSIEPTRGELYKHCESIGEAKRWVRKQEASQPGSVRVERVEQKPRSSAKEIRELAQAQRRDDVQQARDRKSPLRQLRPNQSVASFSEGRGATLSLRGQEQTPRNTRSKKGFRKAGSM